MLHRVPERLLSFDGKCRYMADSATPARSAMCFTRVASYPWSAKHSRAASRMAPRWLGRGISSLSFVAGADCPLDAVGARGLIGSTADCAWSGRHGWVSASEYSL